MSPGSGSVGDTVTLRGSGFGATVTVAFSGTSATIQSAQRDAGGNVTIRCTVPQGATRGPVTVTSKGATVTAGNFTVR